MIAGTTLCRAQDLPVGFMAGMNRERVWRMRRSPRGPLRFRMSPWVNGW